jgi:hypothetical protein
MLTSVMAMLSIASDAETEFVNHSTEFFPVKCNMLYFV